MTGVRDAATHEQQLGAYAVCIVLSCCSISVACYVPPCRQMQRIHNRHVQQQLAKERQELLAAQG